MVRKRSEKPIPNAEMEGVRRVLVRPRISEDDGHLQYDSWGNQVVEDLTRAAACHKLGHIPQRNSAIRLSLLDLAPDDFLPMGTRAHVRGNRNDPVDTIAMDPLFNYEINVYATLRSVGDVLLTPVGVPICVAPLPVLPATVHDFLFCATNASATQARAIVDTPPKSRPELRQVLEEKRILVDEHAPLGYHRWLIADMLLHIYNWTADRRLFDMGPRQIEKLYLSMKGRECDWILERDVFRLGEALVDASLFPDQTIGRCYAEDIINSDDGQFMLPWQEGDSSASPLLSVEKHSGGSMYMIPKLAKWISCFKDRLAVEYAHQYPGPQNGTLYVCPDGSFQGQRGADVVTVSQLARYTGPVDGISRVVVLRAQAVPVHKLFKSPIGRLVASPFTTTVLHVDNRMPRLPYAASDMAVFAPPPTTPKIPYESICSTLVRKPRPPVSADWGWQSVLVSTDQLSEVKDYGQFRLVVDEPRRCKYYGNKLRRFFAARTLLGSLPGMLLPGERVVLKTSSGPFAVGDDAHFVRLTSDRSRCTLRGQGGQANTDVAYSPKLFRTTLCTTVDAFTNDTPPLDLVVYLVSDARHTYATRRILQMFAQKLVVIGPCMDGPAI